MDMADMSNIEFDRGTLKFSLTERGTPDLKLKTKQLEALRAVVQQKRDVLAVLPTGYGKSLIYQLLPSMFNFLWYGIARLQFLSPSGQRDRDRSPR